MSIKVKKGKKYKAGVNLMHQDPFNMGQRMGTNVYLLFGQHPSEEMKYLIVVDETTGESVRLTFDKEVS